MNFNKIKYALNVIELIQRFPNIILSDFYIWPEAKFKINIFISKFIKLEFIEDQMHAAFTFTRDAFFASYNEQSPWYNSIEINTCETTNLKIISRPLSV